jgi:hypothetical protein
MRTSRLFVVAVMAALSVVAVSVSGVPARGRDNAGERAQSLPAGSFVVTGNVAQKLRLSVANLAGMPNQQRVEVTYRAGGGTEHHVFTGPLLATTQDGVSLADQGPRLVVPGDIAGGRYVTGVVRVRIDKPGR